MGPLANVSLDAEGDGGRKEVEGVYGLGPDVVVEVVVVVVTTGEGAGVYGNTIISPSISKGIVGPKSKSFASNTPFVGASELPPELPPVLSELLEPCRILSIEKPNESGKPPCAEPKEFDKLPAI